MNDPSGYWWRAARWPLAAFVLSVLILSMTDADVGIARSFFFDAVHVQWIGAHNGWVDAIHTQGRWAIRSVMILALGAWIATFANPALHSARRPAAYLCVSMVLTVAIVGGLKLVTNVDCPWDLTLFGGRYPYIHLFADRPDDLRAGGCFPAAHASSGYALMSLYFLLRDRNRRMARAGLAIGIMAGLMFGIAQQARGAHFVSHDLWSAILAWMIPLTVYSFGFRCGVWAATVPALHETQLMPVSAGSRLD